MGRQSTCRNLGRGFRSTIRTLATTALASCTTVAVVLVTAPAWHGTLSWGLILRIATSALLISLGFSLVLAFCFDQLADGETAQWQSDFDRLRGRVERQTAQLTLRNRELGDSGWMFERMMRELDESNAHVDLLERISLAAHEGVGNTGTGDIESLLATLQVFCESTPWRIGHLYERIEPHDELRETAQRVIPGPQWQHALDELKRLRESPGRSELIREATRTAQIVTLVDLQHVQNPATQNWAKTFGLKSAMAIPLLAGNRVIGVVELFAEESLQPDHRQLRLVRHLARQLGHAMERRSTAVEARGMQQRCIETAHAAGMAEIAAQVLHNMGNILNGICVNSSLLQDRLDQTSLHGLIRAIELVERSGLSLVEFIATDERGRHFPDYFLSRRPKLESELQELRRIADSLVAQADHLREIVRRQQAYATRVTATVETDLEKLLEEALALHHDAFTTRSIDLTCECQIEETILVDRHKVLQILINLLQNAVDAVEHCTPGKRQITVRAENVDETRVAIEVTDNGIGIVEQDRAKIFTIGFTTKPDGHGIGLHSSALAAKEIDGELQYHSAGRGRGATFRLVFPRQSAGQPAKQEATADSLPPANRIPAIGLPYNPAVPPGHTV